MIVVRLEDETTVFGFSPKALVARRAGGGLDTFWDRAAADSVIERGGDLRGGLLGLPGARVIYASAARSAATWRQGAGDRPQEG